MSGDVIRLGIIGCGTVVEGFHLPAIRKARSVQVVALADIQTDRIQALAVKYDIPLATQEYTELFGKVDAVLIALPHQLHAPVAIEFLERGVHVLCEKPMATSVDEAERMLEAARLGQAKLAVGMVRRSFDNARYIKRGLSAGFFGPVEHFEAEDSVSFDGVDVSEFYLRADEPGAGLLFDTGSHLLDMLLWWFGDVQQVTYWDDNRGGVEANCYLELEMKSGVRGTVELSRMRRLSNVIRIHTQTSVIKVPTLKMQSLKLEDPQLDLVMDISIENPQASRFDDPWEACFARQMENFVAAILKDRSPTAPGEDVLRSIKLIETCQAVRQPLARPAWECFPEEEAA